ncbi:aminotransferase class V-fold PLP-dependent enzyme [Streptomyces fimicarius]|uniref:aminotransferase class V-fold PLP-dependent enzyme n=1 Tax=Streptomyces griseus TaxID=1911 RepID=UPI0036B67887
MAALRSETPGCRQVIHFNNAGCGLLAAPVLDAMVGHLNLEARIGGYEASAARAGEVRAFYAEIAALINTTPDNIAFAGSATHAYANALSSIPFEADDVILTTRDDFISNQIAFLSLRKRFGVRIVHAPDAPEGGVDVEAMAALMRSLRPRLVSATHVPTNSGLVSPVAEIGRHCRELDLLYMVDACQSVGQFVIDVEEIGCDLLTATCRKFLRGPRGSGFLYVSDRVLRAGYEPLFIDMHGARWTAPGDYEPVGTAARFEEWEFPYATVLGSAAATRYARKVGIEAIEQRTPALAARLRDRLRFLPGVRVLDRGPRLAALVTFGVEAGSRTRSRRPWTPAASTRPSASASSRSSTSRTRTSNGACACRRTTTTPRRRWTTSPPRSRISWAGGADDRDGGRQRGVRGGQVTDMLFPGG